VVVVVVVVEATAAMVITEVLVATVTEMEAN
jgi:hypothetical protein